jgi:hypothetical protein
MAAITLCGSMVPCMVPERYVSQDPILSVRSTVNQLT